LANSAKKPGTGMASAINKSVASLKQIEEEALSVNSKQSKSQPLKQQHALPSLVRTQTSDQKPPEISDQSEIENDSFEDYIPSQLNSVKANVVKNEKAAGLFTVKSEDKSTASQKKKDPDSIGAFIDEIMNNDSNNPVTPARKSAGSAASKQPTSVVKSLVFDNPPPAAGKYKPNQTYDHDPDSIEVLDNDGGRKTPKQKTNVATPVAGGKNVGGAAVSLLAESLPPPGFRNMEPGELIDIDIAKKSTGMPSSFRLPHSNNEPSSLSELLRSDVPAKRSSPTKDAKPSKKDAKSKKDKKGKKDEISGLSELLRSELQANNPGKINFILSSWDSYFSKFTLA
jgi:hypothetical protein